MLDLNFRKPIKLSNRNLTNLTLWQLSMQQGIQAQRQAWRQHRVIMIVQAARLRDLVVFVVTFVKILNIVWTKCVVSPGAHRRCTWPPGGCGRSLGPRHNESLAQLEPGERGLGLADGPDRCHVLTGTRHNLEGRSESCSVSKNYKHIQISYQLTSCC